MYGPLLRSHVDRKVAGVCAAFARSYGWDVTVVRIAALIVAMTTGFGFIAYVVCWVAIPDEPFGAAYPQAYAYPPPPPQGYYQPPAQSPVSRQEAPRETPPAV